MSNLGVGQVIFFFYGMDKAVQVGVTRESDTSGMVPSDLEIQINTQKYYCANYKKGLIEGFELLNMEPTLEQFQSIHYLQTENVIFKLLEHISDLNDRKKQADFDQLNQNIYHEVNKVLNLVGEEFFLKYLNKYGFKNCFLSQNTENMQTGIQLVRKYLRTKELSNSEVLEIQDLLQPLCKA